MPGIRLREEGQTIVEYAIVMLLIALALAALFAGAGTSIENAVDAITNALTTLG